MAYKLDISWRSLKICFIFPSVFSDDNNFINNENSQSVGILSWILDNSKYMKMDDDLPLCLFFHGNIEKCVLSGRIDLAYSLRPCTLLHYPFMKNHFDHCACIEMLFIAYSIAFLYLCELEEYSSFKKTILHIISIIKEKINFPPK